MENKILLSGTPILPKAISDTRIDSTAKLHRNFQAPVAFVLRRDKTSDTSKEFVNYCNKDAPRDCGAGLRWLEDFSLLRSVHAVLLIDRSALRLLCKAPKKDKVHVEISTESASAEHPIL